MVRFKVGDIVLSPVDPSLKKELRRQPSRVVQAGDTFCEIEILETGHHLSCTTEETIKYRGDATWAKQYNTPLSRDVLAEVLEKYPNVSDGGWYLSEVSAGVDYDEFTQAVEWLKERERAGTASDVTSYGWKHVMERLTKTYVSNGAFIAAALFLGFPVKPNDTPNPTIGIKRKSSDPL